MNRRSILNQTLTLISFSFAIFSPHIYSQIDEDQIGAWYMYFWNTRIEGSNFGFQGDAQHRNWDSGGDLEQLLLRGGLTWSTDRIVAIARATLSP